MKPQSNTVPQNPTQEPINQNYYLKQLSSIPPKTHKQAPFTQNFIQQNNNLQSIHNLKNHPDKSKSVNSPTENHLSSLTSSSNSQPQPQLNEDQNDDLRKTVPKGLDYPPQQLNEQTYRPTQPSRIKRVAYFICACFGYWRQKNQTQSQGNDIYMKQTKKPNYGGTKKQGQTQNLSHSANGLKNNGTCRLNFQEEKIEHIGTPQNGKGKMIEGKMVTSCREVTPDGDCLVSMGKKESYNDEEESNQINKYRKGGQNKQGQKICYCRKDNCSGKNCGCHKFNRKCTNKCECVECENNEVKKVMKGDAKEILSKIKEQKNKQKGQESIEDEGIYQGNQFERVNFEQNNEDAIEQEGIDNREVNGLDMEHQQSESARNEQNMERDRQNRERSEENRRNQQNQRREIGQRIPQIDPPRNIFDGQSQSVASQNMNQANESNIPEDKPNNPDDGKQNDGKQNDEKQKDAEFYMKYTNYDYDYNGPQLNRRSNAESNLSQASSQNLKYLDIKKKSHSKADTDIEENSPSMGKTVKKKTTYKAANQLAQTRIKS